MVFIWNMVLVYLQSGTEKWIFDLAEASCASPCVQVLDIILILTGLTEKTNIARLKNKHKFCINLSHIDQYFLQHNYLFTEILCEPSQVLLFPHKII